MKTNLIRWVIASFIAVTIQISHALAQQHSDTTGKSRYISKVMTDLGVSYEQAAEMQKIVQENRVSMAGFLKDDSKTTDEKRMEVQSLSLHTQTRLMALLTPLQQQKFKERLRTNSNLRQVQKRTQLLLKEDSIKLSHPVAGGTLKTKPIKQ